MPGVNVALLIISPRYCVSLILVSPTSWMSEHLCVLLLPSFLCSLTSVLLSWSLMMPFRPTHGMLGLEGCPGDSLDLTTVQRRPGPGSKVTTCSLSDKKLVPVPDWNADALISVAEHFLPQHLSPLLLLLDSFFCTPFSDISLWAPGCYLSLVLLLPYHLFFCFFPNSLFLLRGSRLEYGLWPFFFFFFFFFTPCLLSLGHSSILWILWIRTSMRKTPNTPSRLLQWSSSQVSKEPCLPGLTSSSQSLPRLVPLGELLHSLSPICSSVKCRW